MGSFRLGLLKSVDDFGFGTRDVEGLYFPPTLLQQFQVHFSATQFPSLSQTVKPSLFPARFAPQICLSLTTVIKAVVVGYEKGPLAWLMMSPQRILIYLLRRDLRLADNPIFHEIHKLSQSSHCPFTHLLPIYVFPAQQIEVSGFLSSPDSRSPFPEARSEIGNFWRCGPFRVKFLVESLFDLRRDLDGVGNGLVLRVGRLGQVVKDLLDAAKKKDEDVSVAAVWMTAEEGTEEKKEESDVKRAADLYGVDFRLCKDEKFFVDE